MIVSEIMYDAPGSDTHQEWIELFNSGTSAVDIKSWKINDGSNHVLNVPPKNGGMGSTLVMPNSYVVLASDAAQFRVLYPNVANVIDTTISLSNSADTISLVDASSTVKDTVSYDSSVGGAGDGNSLNRISGSITFSPRAPSPGAVEAPHVIPPPPSKTVPPKAPKVSTAKPATLPRTQVVLATAEDQVPTSPRDKSIEISVPDSPQVSAAAEVAPPPLFAFSWWWVGAALFALLGSALMMMSRVAAKKEWDIIEENA